MSTVKLPRSAIVALALSLTFSTAVLAETGDDAAPGSYYNDPLFSIDRGVDKAHIPTPEQDHDLPTASAKSTRTVAEETGDSGASAPTQQGTPGCAGNGERRCDGAPEYFPDSHINLDYFPARSSYTYFPAMR